LRVCNFHFLQNIFFSCKLFNSIFFFASAAFLFVLPQQSVFSEDSGVIVTMPTIGGVDSPSMPTLSSPTIGDGFYTPENKTDEIYTGRTSSNTTKKTSSTSASSSTSVSSTSSSKNSSDSSAKKTDTSNLSIDNIISSLSASDISSLGNMGLLSSLTGSDTSSSISNLYTSSSNSSTNVLLKEVLSELEELKKTQNENNEKTSVEKKVSQTTNAESTTNTASNAVAKTPAVPHSSLLRFTVNGYNILKTCRVVYISKIDSNNSFILTGDRKYQSDGETRTETFYLLFKPNGVVGGQKSYSVAAAVTQDYLNKYSFLYQLAQKNNLTATQTGNLVILRTDDSSWKLDLLLDLEEQ